MLKICLSLATSCPNFVYLHQKSKDNATQQCKKAPPPTSSHPPSLLTPHSSPLTYSIVKITKLEKIKQNHMTKTKTTTNAFRPQKAKRRRPLIKLQLRTT